MTSLPALRRSLRRWSKVGKCSIRKNGNSKCMQSIIRHVDRVAIHPSISSNINNSIIITRGAASLAVTRTENKAYKDCQNDEGVFLLSISAALATSSAMVAMCQKEQPQEAEAAAVLATREQEEEEEEDPYDNLPEEDEPTTCSLCLTYRQGPCRPFWRKYEYCVKDQTKNQQAETDVENNDANDQCMRYVVPFAQCASTYIRLYDMVGNQTQQQEFLDQPENIAVEANALPVPDHLPIHVDTEALSHEWMLLFGQEYAQDALDSLLSPIGTSTSHPSSSPSSSAQTSLASSASTTPVWKNYEGEEDVVGIYAIVKIPKIDPKTGYSLSAAYARDQDGLVMGLSYASAKKNDDNDTEKPKEAASEPVSDHNGDSKYPSQQDTAIAADPPLEAPDNESPHLSKDENTNPDTDTDKSRKSTTAATTSKEPKEDDSVQKLWVLVLPDRTRSFEVYAAYQSPPSTSNNSSNNNDDDQKTLNTAEPSPPVVQTIMYKTDPQHVAQSIRPFLSSNQ